MTCIKTGARVYLVEYDQTLPADIFEVGNCVVLRLNMSLFDTVRSNWGGECATHTATIGEDHYWNKREGTLVVPKEHLMEL